MSTDSNLCRVCDQATLQEIEQYRNLARVTSDCKPFRSGGRLVVCTSCGTVQKPTDAEWQAEADEIYKQYSPYHSSGGKEQAVFDPAVGAPRQRSAVLLDRVANHWNVAERGTVLDVGAGNGALLSAFSELRPHWSLNAHDLSEVNLEDLKAIPGFDTLHTVALPDVPDRYDIVTMIHSLEHFVDPIGGLREIKPLVGDDGCLLIEVPNAAVTPFDLLVADHVTHFSLPHLGVMLDKAGLDTVALSDNWVTKELSALGKLSGNEQARSGVTMPDPNAVLKRVTAQIDWLNAVAQTAQAAAEGSQKFGLFGTSIAATWLYGQISDKIEFFIDEDPNCRGRTLNGKPIYHPSDAPSNATVYVMLIPAVANAVAKRLSGSDTTYVVPPELQSDI